MKQKVWMCEFDFFFNSLSRALEKHSAHMSLPRDNGSALGTIDGQANGRHGRPVVP
jgi:hypothetical protein